MKAETVTAALEKLYCGHAGCANYEHKDSWVIVADHYPHTNVYICAACLAELLTPDDGKVTVRMSLQNWRYVSVLVKEDGWAGGSQEVASTFDAALKAAR